MDGYKVVIFVPRFEDLALNLDLSLSLYTGFPETGLLATRAFAVTNWEMRESLVAVRTLQCCLQPPTISFSDEMKSVNDSPQIITTVDLVQIARQLTEGHFDSLLAL